MLLHPQRVNILKTNRVYGSQEEWIGADCGTSRSSEGTVAFDIRKASCSMSLEEGCCFVAPPTWASAPVFEDEEHGEGRWHGLERRDAASSAFAKPTGENVATGQTITMRRKER